MRFLVAVSGFVVAVAFVLALAFGPAQAQSPENDLSWQSVITNQIEAFRRGDAGAALGFAGAGFRTHYSDPAAFYADIKRMGYGPIVDSRGHSFGGFERVEDHAVLQIVTVQGPDQGLYEALYRMGEEDGGWRVQGVFMRKQAGVGI
jgi:hypothetical protein